MGLDLVAIRLLQANLLLLSVTLTLALAASAQLGTALTATISPSDAYVHPGVDLPVTVTANRICQSASQVLSASDAEITWTFETEGASASGPATIKLPQQVCATKTEESFSFNATLKVPSSLGQALKGELKITNDPGAPNLPSSIRVAFAYPLNQSSAATGNATSNISQAANASVKSPAPVIPIVGLGVLAVAALRRRTA